MIERYVHHLRVEQPPDTEDAAGARERLRDKFPRQALRRMTHLGMLIGSTLEGLTLGPEDAMVYATSFGETRALEDFLASFPAASPLGFQTSIHPGGVQQVLIGRQQPIGRLWPHAGRARLVEQALTSVLLETSPRVLLVGGEERGTWLRDEGSASEHSFAFAAGLRREPGDGDLARVSFEPYTGPCAHAQGYQEVANGAVEEPNPTLEAFVAALAARQPIGWRGAGGTWRWTWR